MTNQILSATYLILLGVFVTAGIVMIPFTLPGTWVIAAAALLYSLVRDFPGHSDVTVVVVCLGLALAGEVIEFITGTLGAKKDNVPTGAIVCSIIGGIIGAIVGVPVLIVGSLLGLLLGTYLGALIYVLIKEKSTKLALRNAWDVLTSRVISIFAKTAVGIGMSLYLAFQVF